MRIITIHHLINNADLTFSISSVFIWSCCEPFIGIVCACLPCYAPIFRRVWKNASSLSRSRTTPTPGGYGTGSKKMGPDSKASWNRITNTTKSEDEVQLTTYVTGPPSTRTKDSDHSGMKGIHVKSDITWESHQV